MHHEVYDGFGKALWAQAYAQAIDELVESKELKRAPWGPGDEITRYVPSMPAGLAARVEALFDKKFGVDAKAVVEAAYEASREDRYAAPKDAEDFGWQLGMRWVGHGTDLAEAGEEVEAKLGHGEFYVDVEVDRTGAPGKATISYTNLPKSVTANRRGSKRRGSKKRR